MCRKHYAIWYYSSTLEKSKADKKAWSSLPSNKRRAYDRQLKNTYGISIEQYEVMIADQGGGCAICNRQPGNRRLHVDHCHETGKIRGILCSGCNTALGLLNDNPDLIDKASDYLRKFK